MSILDVIQTYWTKGLIVLLLGGGLIEFSPIRFNPLTWIAKRIGNALNSDLLFKVNKIEKDLLEHMEANDKTEAKAVRLKILEFADEIQLHQKHSQEHFNHILINIKDYNLYCKNHPDFYNNIANHAIQYIEDEYDRCLREHDFL